MEQTDCPIAKKSLLAYLSGRLDGSGEGAEFEAHVKECDVCRSLVGDRRKALQVLIAAIDDSGQVAESAPKQLPGLKKGQARMLAVTGALAIGLIALSYFVKPGSSLLGEKFGDTMPIVEVPKQMTSGPLPDTRVRFEEQQEENVAALAVEPEAQPAEPALDQGQQKPPNPTKPKPKPVARKSPPAPKPADVNRVEVYDASGKKVGETVHPR